MVVDLAAAASPHHGAVFRSAGAADRVHRVSREAAADAWTTSHLPDRRLTKQRNNNKRHAHHTRVEPRRVTMASTYTTTWIQFCRKNAAPLNAVRFAPVDRRFPRWRQMRRESFGRRSESSCGASCARCPACSAGPDTTNQTHTASQGQHQVTHGGSDNA